MIYGYVCLFDNQEIDSELANQPRIWKSEYLVEMIMYLKLVHSSRVWVISRENKWRNKNKL